MENIFSLSDDPFSRYQPNYADPFSIYHNNIALSILNPLITPVQPSQHTGRESTTQKNESSMPCLRKMAALLLPLEIPSTSKTYKKKKKNRKHKKLGTIRSFRCMACSEQHSRLYHFPGTKDKGPTIDQHLKEKHMSENLCLLCGIYLTNSTHRDHAMVHLKNWKNEKFVKSSVNGPRRKKNE